jgi:broad specificity phosphatase PhoE
MNAMKRRIFGAALAFVLLGPAGSLAQTVDVKALAETLKSGGYVIVFRHGATNRDQADTDPLNFDNVSRQRLLSDAGRQAAAQVGLAFKTLQIPIGKIYTSRFNRAVETGRLIGAGDVSTTPDLTEGGLVVTPIENDRRAQALREMVAVPPEKGKNTLLVTHKPNILDAFGKDWFDVKEGEASIFRPTGDGKATLVARVQAADWINAAK